VDPIYYASGTNKAGEIRGMAKAGRDLGVAADQCLSRGAKTGIRCEDALLEVAKRYPELRVFVDSGAFSEVEFDKAAGELVTTKPISQAEWGRRLGLMERVGRAFGSRLLVMAPDKIADQQETLRRLRWFKRSGWLERLRRTGAEIAVVLQGGALDPVAFDAQAAKALGWSGYAIAFPMMKGATPLELIRAFMANRVARRVHLLGVGPKGKAAPAIRRELFSRYPRVLWSWDSAAIRGAVLRQKDRIGAYTAAQDLVRQEIQTELLRGQVKVGRRGFALDLTDMAGQPSLYLLDLWGWPAVSKAIRELQAKRRTANTPRGRKLWRDRKVKWDAARSGFRARAERTARAAGLHGHEIARFIADPDGFSQSPTDEPRIVYDPVYSHALEAAFDQWAKLPFDKGGPPEISELIAERAIYLAFKPAEPAVQRGLPGFLEAV
jgi:hypothetical protein